MEIDRQAAKQIREEKAKNAKISFGVQRYNSTTPTQGHRHNTSYYLERMEKGEVGNPEIIEGRDAPPQAFISPKDGRYKHLAPPPRLGMLSRLYSNGRLRLRHLRALNLFLTDCARAQGSSKGLTAQLSEKVDCPKTLKAPEAYLGSYGNDAYYRYKHIYNGLRNHELALLVWSVVQEMLTTDEIVARDIDRSGDQKNVETIGAACDGYKHKTAASSAGTARLHALLDSIAELYGLREE